MINLLHQKGLPYSLGVMRILVGLLFMQHGMQKYFHFPPVGHMQGEFKLLSLFGVAGTLELFGGVLMAAGLFVRPTAFLLAGEMAVACWMIHFASGLNMEAGYFPVVNGVDLSILFCFVFLHLFFAGPGAWSLDGARTQNTLATQRRRGVD